VCVPEGQAAAARSSLHSGRLEEAKRFARALIERFENAPADTIVINAAGCGSTLKEYGDSWAGEPAYAARARRFQQGPRP